MKWPWLVLLIANFAIAQSAKPAAEWHFDPHATDDIRLGAIGEYALPTGPLTIEAWLRVDNPGEWGGVFSALQDNGAYERGWLLGYKRETFCVALASEKVGQLTYLMADTSFNPGLWHHLAASYDGRELRIYLDGKPAGSSTAQSGDILYPPKGVVAVGAYIDDNEHYPLSGAIADLAIWHQPLSPETIAARFAAGKNRFPDIAESAAVINGWPTYRRDSTRSGSAPTALELPISLLWQVANPTPRPAWPPPAKRDFWNKKHDLRARVTYDHVDHVVAQDQVVIQGSSAADYVTCRDLATGQERWRFVSEGPVRLAPNIADKRVVFGSDDGHVYCLNLADGHLIWHRSLAPDSLRIPGNGRIISAWPVRGGPLVHGDLVHACAGIFPEQGVYRVSLKLTNGEIVQRKPLSASAQGYLSRNGARLVVPTGRDPKGATLTVLRGRSSAKVQPSTPEPFHLASIRAGDQQIGGGDGKVGLFQGDKLVWQAPVEGRALGLAICDQRLLVSTDTGRLYAFGVGQPQSAHTATPVATKTRGYLLRVGDVPHSPADARVIHLLAESANARLSASRKPDYGSRQVIHELRTPLPYGDYLFNRIEAQAGLVPNEELMRVLRPGGVALIGGEEFRRSPLVDAGEWTHLYGNAANTACSGDAHVGGDLALQWFGEPGPQKMLDRHHRTVAPLSKNGTLIVPGNNYLYGVDAYNGSVWWEREIPESRRAAAFRDCGGMALTDDHLYIASGPNCLDLDPHTGATLHTHRAPKAERDWGYVAAVDGRLFGSTVRTGGSRRGHSRATIVEGTYWDFKPLVTSDSIFAHGLWHYQPKGAIVNSTITVTDNLICFAESANPDTLEAENGRVSPRILFGKGSRLVALDVETGVLRWERILDADEIAHTSYLAYSDDKLVLTGSKNGPKQVLYQIWVFDVGDGSLLWETTQEQGTKIGGDHGEQDHHLVIIGDRLIVEPHAYSLGSGSPLDNWGWSKRHRRGCGTISASLSTLFFRQQNPARFDLASNKTAKVTAVTRPGCWINMIPVGGLLLIPEASSGCSCNFGVQSSIAFRPVQK